MPTSKSPADSIPVAAPTRWFQQNLDAVLQCQQRVVESGQLILGPEVAAFETEFARFCRREHTVAVASGTDAVSLILRSLSVSGGEVITSGHAPAASIAAIRLAGAEPVLADVEASYHCLSPDAVSGLISERTRAVLAIHMHGHPADVHGLLEVLRGTPIPLVEDCAQAHGALVAGLPVGGFGVAAAFSFYPTKNLGAMGDAGAIVTDSEDLAMRMKSLRQYGWDENRNCLCEGGNSRMDELQAAILRLRLQHWDADFGRRKMLAYSYSRALRTSSPIIAPALRKDCEHAFHHYVVECEEREALMEHLRSRGIQTAIHYPVPIHRQPAFTELRRSESLGRVESLYGRVLTLPLYPELKDEEALRVCDALSEYER